MSCASSTSYTQSTGGEISVKMTHQIGIKEEPRSPQDFLDISGSFMKVEDITPFEQADVNGYFQQQVTAGSYNPHFGTTPQITCHSGSGVNMEPFMGVADIKTEIHTPYKNNDVKGILKQSVKNKLQAKGLSVNHQDLFPEPQEMELTQSDLERRERRKDQNRRAAKRCRTKKRKLQEEMAYTTQELADDNKALSNEIQSLKQELANLKQILDIHLRSGQCRIPHLTEQQMSIQGDKVDNLMVTQTPVAQINLVQNIVAPLNSPAITSSDLTQTSGVPTENLPSWDLSNIIIDHTCLSQQVGEELGTDQNTMETFQDLGPFCSERNDGEKASFVRNLTNEFLAIEASQYAAGSYQSQQCQSSDFMDPNSMGLLQEHDDDIFVQSVSPNLVQPYSSSIPARLDLINSSSNTTLPSVKSLLTVPSISPSSHGNLCQSEPSPFAKQRAIFTFEAPSPCAKSETDLNSEPISPFFTSFSRGGS